MPIETKTYKHYWTDKKWWQNEDYVEFPVLTYKKHYARTKTVERKIKSLLRRGKSFILNLLAFFNLLIIIPVLFKRIQ